MDKISVNISSLPKYTDFAVGTYYYDKDLVLENTTDFSVFTIKNLSGKGTSITMSKIEDGKVPANTAIFIQGPYGTKTVDFIVPDKNTFKKLDSIGFGVVTKIPFDKLYYNVMCLSVDSSTGKPAFFEWDLDTNNYLPTNKALIPFSIYWKTDITYINDYYYDVTGLHFDVAGLYAEYKDKPLADRQKILDKLLWHITGIQSCDNYFNHRRHEGKNQSANQTSYLHQMLTNLFIHNM